MSLGGRESSERYLLEPTRAPSFPKTRYQGSKAKLADWIWHSIKEMPFQSVLDVFGGTGCISYRLKAEGKAVTYNDYLLSNAIMARALIENDDEQIPSQVIEGLAQIDEKNAPNGFIADTFAGIYFTEAENRWLDAAIGKLSELETHPYVHALAFFAVAQACIVKRPYNLFHRRNLYIRFAEVERSFGNKASWDKPFSQWIPTFATEANRAVFSGAHPSRVLNLEAIEVPGSFDLVYMDPPYITKNGTGVDYRQFYHFLEGLAQYLEWETLIDYGSKHLRMNFERDSWTRPKQIAEAFDQLFEKHSKSQIVVSYRSDGIPSIDELVDLLRRHKKVVRVIEYGQYKYVLSRNSKSREVLVVGEG